MKNDITGITLPIGARPQEKISFNPKLSSNSTCQPATFSV